jgi:hypothetical protein
MKAKMNEKKKKSVRKHGKERVARVPAQHN